MRVKVYRSLLLPNRFLGCDRELTMLLTLMCIAVPVLSASLLNAVLCLFCFGAGLMMLKTMSRKDPLYRQVYLRFLRYSSRVYLGGAPSYA
ncbi:MAG: VirB3 family type IV secretion system protein [Succinivibrio sp.]|nr:VirB3 family type IV secretion system protein [Succinivibrio sp.]